MSPQTTFLRSLLLQAVVVSAGAQAHHRAEARSQSIEWGPCPQNGTLPILCGNLTVPLDYSAPNSTETLNLALLKVPAVKAPSKGSLLINFGGPGDAGRDTLAALAAQLQATTGGYNDLISFDPRGTGITLPFSCYQNDTAKLAAGIQSQVLAANASDTTPGRDWALAKNEADNCYANNKNTSSLIGSVFTAKDMMQIVDALGEDGLLRYLGYSYGTALGALTAAMFPDKMDRVILDGVLNPHEYFHGYDVQMYAGTDATFSAFISSCLAAGPSVCALAGLNATASSIESSIYDMMYQLKQRPIAFEGALIDYSLIRGLILLTLYDPSSYGTLATALAALLTDDLAAAAAALVGSDAAVSAANDGRNGIACGDKGADVFASASPANGYDQKYLPTIAALEQTSRLAGDTAVWQIAVCGQWDVEAKERYRGDFVATTRHPILLIGNTHDPVTPLASAHNASDGFEGSVVLAQDGFGHTSLGQTSLCTANAYAAYLVNGTLPAPGTVCEVDIPLFSNKTWADVLL